MDLATNLDHFLEDYNLVKMFKLRSMASPMRISRATTTLMGASKLQFRFIIKVERYSRLEDLTLCILIFTIIYLLGILNRVQVDISNITTKYLLCIITILRLGLTQLIFIKLHYREVLLSTLLICSTSSNTEIDLLTHRRTTSIFTLTHLNHSRLYSSSPMEWEVHKLQLKVTIHLHQLPAMACQLMPAATLHICITSLKRVDFQVPHITTWPDKEASNLLCIFLSTAKISLTSKNLPIST